MPFESVLTALPDPWPDRPLLSAPPTGLCPIGAFDPPLVNVIWLVGVDCAGVLTTPLATSPPPCAWRITEFVGARPIETDGEVGEDADVDAPDVNWAPATVGRARNITAAQ